MSILITGSNGFIGSHLAKALSDSGEKVVALTHNCFSTKWLDEALKNCIKVRGDLRDFNLLKRVIARHEVSKVFHLGALCKVKTAHKDPINVYDVNVMGTVNVLEACRQVGVEKTLVLITDKIFGERMNATENDPIQASEPYATSKGCAQLVCESYCKTYGLVVMPTRSCNVYGLDYSNRIVPNTIRSCLRGESPLIFRGETETLRQYIHVKDVVEALIHLMNKKHPQALRSYNVCTKDVLNQEDLVQRILGFFPTIKPEYVRREAPPEIWRQTMILSNFGWKPKIQLQAGLFDTINKFKKYGW